MINTNYKAGDGFPAQQPDSSGMALVVVVILAAVAGILAAGLHYAGGSRIMQARQEMRFDKAFFVAEAGVERAKATLKTDVTNGTLYGGLTNYGEGRFQINIQDNGNNIYTIRSTGIVETAARVIEVVVSNTPFVPGSSDGAFCIYGTNTDLKVKGSGAIDGNDWNLPTTLGGDDETVNTNNAMPGVFTASVTNTINPQKSDSIIGNPAITNGIGQYDEAYWLELANGIMPSHVYVDGDSLGTRASPVVTLLPSNATTFNGTRAGAGILIVPGDATLKINGTFDFEGLIIMLGDGQIDVGEELSATGTAKIFGAIVCVGGELDINIQGTFDLNYSSQALANLAQLEVPSQLDMISWNEYKPSSTNW